MGEKKKYFVLFADVMEEEKIAFLSTISGIFFFFSFSFSCRVSNQKNRIRRK